MKVSVIGLVGSIPFQKAKGCAEDLQVKFPRKFEAPSILGLLEFEWNEYKTEKMKELRGELWAFKGEAMIFLDGEVIGSPEEFLHWAKEEYDYDDFRPQGLYETITEEAYFDELRRRQHVFVYLDIAINEENIGRLLIELYTTLVPKTCENFRALCTGEKEESVHNSVERFKLHYLNSCFHRIVPSGWIQGGDIWYGKGNGGESIYGPTFEDENFSVSHARRGMISMANQGRHTNGSQFFISLKPIPYFDTKFVAFGRIVEGFDVLAAMEKQPTNNERPLREIKIIDCGEKILY
jgi:peptidyl-prolyl cis-trans isomerase-like 6